jgi:hypothetical protein
LNEQDATGMQSALISRFRSAQEFLRETFYFSQKILKLKKKKRKKGPSIRPLTWEAKQSTSVILVN